MTSTARRCGPPYENIWVCSEPSMHDPDFINTFNVFINVADAPLTLFKYGHDKYYHWYPLNEGAQWGYGWVYWAKKVLDFHHERLDNIFLHCLGGVHRSPQTLMLWLQSKGHSLKEAAQILNHNNENDRAFVSNQWSFHLDTEKGHIPKKWKELLDRMEKYPQWDLEALLNTKEDPLEESF